MKSRWSEHFSAIKGDILVFLKKKFLLLNKLSKNTEKYNKNCKKLLLKNQTGASTSARPMETHLILNIKILKNIIKTAKKLLLKNQTGTSALARPRETCLILKKEVFAVRVNLKLFIFQESFLLFPHLHY